MYIYIYIHVHVCIYIYREREREIIHTYIMRSQFQCARCDSFSELFLREEMPCNECVGKVSERLREALKGFTLCSRALKRQPAGALRLVALAACCLSILLVLLCVWFVCLLIHVYVCVYVYMYIYIYIYMYICITTYI